LTQTSVSVTVTTVTDVVTTTFTTMNNPGGRFGILNYEYGEIFIFNFKITQLNDLFSIDFDSIINGNSLSEESSKSLATFSSINDDDLLDRDNFIDQQDWLNEITEFNFRY
jgi:hypothetical protein